MQHLQRHGFPTFAGAVHHASADLALQKKIPYLAGVVVFSSTGEASVCQIN